MIQLVLTVHTTTHLPTHIRYCKKTGVAVVVCGMLRRLSEPRLICNIIILIIIITIYTERYTLLYITTLYTLLYAR